MRPEKDDIVDSFIAALRDAFTQAAGRPTGGARVYFEDMKAAAAASLDGAAALNAAGRGKEAVDQASDGVKAALEMHKTAIRQTRKKEHNREARDAYTELTWSAVNASFGLVAGGMKQLTRAVEDLKETLEKPIELPPAPHGGEPVFPAPLGKGWN